MSAQPAQPTVVVAQGSRVRNEGGSQPFFSKKGGGDILFSVGSLAIGGIAGYFLADYAVKNDLINKFLGKIGLNEKPKDTKPAGDVNTGDDDDEEAANLAYITPLWPEVTDTDDTFDRTTRHTTGKVAYPAKRLFTKYYDPDVIENAGEFNQVVTDNNVYE